MEQMDNVSIAVVTVALIFCGYMIYDLISQARKENK